MTWRGGVVVGRVGARRWPRWCSGARVQEKQRREREIEARSGDGRGGRGAAARAARRLLSIAGVDVRLLIEACLPLMNGGNSGRTG